MILCIEIINFLVWESNEYTMLSFLQMNQTALLFQT